MIWKARPVGDLGIIKLLNESHEASPAYPLKSCLARILGRKFSQVIGSNQTQHKHWKGLCPNPTQLQAQQKHCKTHFNHKTILRQTRDSGHSQALTSKRWQGKKSGAVMPAGSHAAKPMKPPRMREAQAVWIHNGFAPCSKLH